MRYAIRLNSLMLLTISILSLTGCAIKERTIFVLGRDDGNGAVVSKAVAAPVHVVANGLDYVQTVTVDIGTKLLINPGPKANKQVTLARTTRMTVTVQDSKGTPVISEADIPAGTVIGLNPLSIPQPKAAPVLVQPAATFQSSTN